MIHLKHISLSLMAVLGLVLLSVTPDTTQAKEKIELGKALGGVKIGGHIHTIATNKDEEFIGGGSEDTGAVDVNSLELGLTASPLKALDANVTLLMEEGFPDGGAPGQDFDVDQAYVVLAGNHRPLSAQDGRGEFDKSPWYAKAGKLYVPFGTNMEYHTFDVITEPQTLALAETLESSFLVGYTPRSGLNAYAGVFSGDGGDSESGRTVDNDIDDFFVGVDASNEIGSFSAQWMNNINNSIALTAEAGATAQEVGGLSLFGSTTRGPTRLQVAHVTALDDYQAGGLTGGGVPGQPEPSATTVELTYNGFTRMWNRSLTGTLVYEQTDEWLDHPEEITGAVIDVPIYTGVTGSLEYLDRDYDRTYSTGLDDDRFISFRLAVGFEEVLSDANMK